VRVEREPRPVASREVEEKGKGREPTSLRTILTNVPESVLDPLAVLLLWMKG